jgi:hypothetical protein
MHLTNPFEDATQGGRKMDDGMAQAAMMRTHNLGRSTTLSWPAQPVIVVSEGFESG